MGAGHLAKLEPRQSREIGFYVAIRALSENFPDIVHPGRAETYSVRSRADALPFPPGVARCTLPSLRRTAQREGGPWSAVRILRLKSGSRGPPVGTGRGPWTHPALATPDRNRARARAAPRATRNDTNRVASARFLFASSRLTLTEVLTEALADMSTRSGMSGDAKGMNKPQHFQRNRSERSERHQEGKRASEARARRRRPNVRRGWALSSSTPPP